ncbi:MAG: hypothetical protein EP343_10445 [Deltaproteobacteria bacterium]|nr:MAG: hypothetical protein EP343_10445 [Deltaproteobacteria bacterium]
MSRSAWLSIVRSMLLIGMASLVVWKWGCMLEIPDVEGWACTSGQDCISPLQCENKVCRRPCFNDKDCKDGWTCSNGFCIQSTVQDGGNTDSLCIPRTGGEVCNGIDDNCNNEVDEGGVCEREGKMCELGAQGTQACTGGLKCISFTLYPDRPRVCLRTCEINDPASCPEKFLCLKAGANGESVCMQTACSSDADCVYQGDTNTGYACTRIGGNNQLCLPAYTQKGPSTVGQRCSPQEGVWCDALTSCTRLSTQVDGICTVRCSQSADCPKDGKSLSCAVLENNIQVCRSKCASTNDCPTDMQCSPTGLCEPKK